MHGFIKIPYDSVYEIIEHPYFQRLRRISQLGLTYLVYPGAVHTRFSHAIGAMHLILKAIDTLRSKNVEITETEREAAAIAILLHDIGHGPFSHTLEHSLIEDVSHEQVSVYYMNQLKNQINGPLDLAIEIFSGRHEKKFLNQLISSQLDMDRLDYLTRDSFYTGVSEGIVGLERIIIMLNVVDNELVIEEKGIYSIEKFIVARRLMYWQVYLHKTTIAADEWLTSGLNRMKWLYRQGEKLHLSPPLEWFIKSEKIKLNMEMLQQFSQLDDSDIIVAFKNASFHTDKVLALMCRGIIDRKLPNISISKTEITEEKYSNTLHYASKMLKINLQDAEYLVKKGSVQNEAYRDKGRGIPIYLKSGLVADIANASDNYSISALRDIVTKFFLISPR